MTTSRCSSCGAAIVWAKTARGKAIPLDALPAAPASATHVLRGEYASAFRGSGIVAAMDAPLLRTTHFVTCEHAALHRRPR